MHILFYLVFTYLLAFSFIYDFNVLLNHTSQSLEKIIFWNANLIFYDRMWRLYKWLCFKQSELHLYFVIYYVEEIKRLSLLIIRFVKLSEWSLVSIRTEHSTLKTEVIFQYFLPLKRLLSLLMCIFRLLMMKFISFIWSFINLGPTVYIWQPLGLERSGYETRCNSSEGSLFQVSS